MPTNHPANSLPDPHTRADFYDGVPTRRLLAWIVDVALIFALCLMILPFTAFTGLLFFPALMLVAGFVYRWLTIAGGSATWGMRVMGIELREADGGRLTGQTAFLHTLAYSIAVAVAPLQLVSVLMMGLGARGQGLGDSLLGTAAINRPL